MSRKRQRNDHIYVAWDRGCMLMMVGEQDSHGKRLLLGGVDSVAGRTELLSFSTSLVEVIIIPKELFAIHTDEDQSYY